MTSSKRIYASFTCHLFSFVQARRRTTTQMELLYANNSESGPDTPTGDFTGHLPLIPKTPDGGPDLEVVGNTVRDYMIPSVALSTRTGTMYVCSNIDINNALYACTVSCFLDLCVVGMFTVFIIFSPSI